MQQPPQPATPSKIESPAQSRRDLLKTSAAAVSAATLASLAFPSGVYAQVEGPIKVGLVGCGGRGSGATIIAVICD